MQDEQDFSETAAYSRPGLRGLQDHSHGALDAPALESKLARAQQDLADLERKYRDVRLALNSAVNQGLDEVAANRRQGLREGLIMARRFAELGVDIRRLDIESLTAD